MVDLRAIALEEFTRRQAKGVQAVAVRRRTVAQANHDLAPWAAIASFFGAELPLEVRPHDGEVAWIDYYSSCERADVLLRRIAEELRRATEVALGRHEHSLRDSTCSEADRVSLCDRARGLARLESHISMRAGLPPWQPAPLRAAAA